MKISSVSSGFSSLVRHRPLLKTLIIRDIHTKYRETIFGYWWLVAYPVLMLATYSFIFGGIFKSRWLNQGGITDFVAMLYCGLIIFGIFSDSINRATTIIRSHPNFVKKVVFPLELLPLVLVGSSVFSALINLGLLIALVLVTKFAIPLSAIFLPVIIVPFIVLVMGLVWGLAAIGVFFPDLSQIVNVFTSIMLFMSPVFFPLASAPTIIQPFLMLNPLTFPIEETRNILLLAQQPNWEGVALYSAVAVTVAWLGFWVFQSSRSAFSDVI